MKRVSRRIWSWRILKLLPVQLLLFQAAGWVDLRSQSYWLSTFDQIAEQSTFRQLTQRLYEEIGLSKKLSKKVFDYSLIGYLNLRCENRLPDTSLLTIVDFSQPSTAKRFYVIDLVERQLLFHSLVAHGKNSGENWARAFSNTSESKQSSLGYFLTSSTYFGKHGYSLKLTGLEPRFNSNAEDRAIVIHGAPYVSEEFIRQYGRLGRSWGCPALPEYLSSNIISTIKDGSCLFIFSDSVDYLWSSKRIDVSAALSELLKGLYGFKPQQAIVRTRTHLSE